MGLRAKASAFGHPKSPHATAIAQRPFTAALQVIFPRGDVEVVHGGDGASAVSEAAGRSFTFAFTDVDEALGRRRKGDSGGGGASAAPDYYAARLTLAQLLDEGFVGSHVRSSGASLHALCVDGRIDRDDVVAVTPDGRAHLSLTPWTYARLGVTGAKTDRGGVKFQCCINLAHPKFKSGGHFCDRVRECAKNIAEEHARMEGSGDAGESRAGGGGALWYLCAFEPHDVASPIVFPWEKVSAEVVPRWLTVHSRLLGDLGDVPELPAAGLFERREGGAPMRMDTDDGDGDGSEEGGERDADREDLSRRLFDFHEWIGSVTCGCIGSVLRKDTTKTRSCGPESCQQRLGKLVPVPEGNGGGAVEVHRWEGLLLPSHASSALDFCREAVNSGRVPWAVLTLWGYADDPTERSSSPSSKARSKTIGERGNDLTFLVLPSDRYVMFSTPM